MTTKLLIKYIDYIDHKEKKSVFSSLLSKKMGVFAKTEHSLTIQNIINTLYIFIFNLDLKNFPNKYKYKSLNELFTRRLIEDREYSTNSEDFIAPCDGKVLKTGKIEDKFLEQVKGKWYNINELLTGSLHCEEHSKSEEKCEKHSNLINGDYINIYLSPRDYHCYHIPIDCKIHTVTHIPGKFYPVNESTLTEKDGLYVENERVVIDCEAYNGKHFYIVLVAALNVGKIKLSFLPDLETNIDHKEKTVFELGGYPMRKGEYFGNFEMGSTILILSAKYLFERKLVNYGTILRYGRTIAKI